MAWIDVEVDEDGKVIENKGDKNRSYAMALIDVKA